MVFSKVDIPPFKDRLHTRKINAGIFRPIFLTCPQCLGSHLHIRNRTSSNVALQGVAGRAVLCLIPKQVCYSHRTKKKEQPVFMHAAFVLQVKKQQLKHLTSITASE